jgi:hypothetical protein
LVGESIRGIDHFRQLCVGGRIIVKVILVTNYEYANLTAVVQDMVQWWDFVITMMNQRVS